MFLFYIPQKFITAKDFYVFLRPVTIQNFNGISSSTSELCMMVIVVSLVVENCEVQRQGWHLLA
jgi:hypothetical protein